MSTESQQESPKKRLKPEPQENVESSETFNLIGNEKRIIKTKHYMGIACLLQDYKGGTYFFQKDPTSSANSKPDSSTNKRGSCIIKEDKRLVSVGWNTVLLDDPKIFENSESLTAILNSNSLLNKNNTNPMTAMPFRNWGVSQVLYSNSL